MCKVCFFLLRSVGRRDRPRAGTGLLLPLPFPVAGAKKKHPGWCFVFCCGPARTLTHSLRAWVAMPPPRRGGVFFCCGPARTGVFFVFCCGPARTLTHSLWAGAISARPGWCFFFCCGPAGPFSTITNNVWGTTSGLKRPGGATAKKKHFLNPKPLNP